MSLRGKTGFLEYNSADADVRSLERFYPFDKITTVTDILNKEPILIIVLHLNDIFFCRDMLVSL